MIHSIIVFFNKMVAVFDKNGNQLPEYQGRIEDVRDKINAVFSEPWEHNESNNHCGD